MGQRFSTTEKNELKNKVKRAIKSVLPSDKQYGCGDELQGNMTHQLFAPKHDFAPPPGARSVPNRDSSAVRRTRTRALSPTLRGSNDHA